MYYLLNLGKYIIYNNIIIQATTAAAATAQSIIQILANVFFSFFLF